MYCVPHADGGPTRNREQVPTVEEAEQRPLFQVVFLKNDGQQRVLVDEVEEIDLEKIRKHLLRGESIFITSRPDQKLETMPSADKHGISSEVPL